MFENPGRGRQARNFTTNVPKILDLKSSSEQISEQIFSENCRWVPLIQGPLCASGWTETAIVLSLLGDLSIATLIGFTVFEPGGYSLIKAIQVCATPKGRVFFAPFCLKTVMGFAHCGLKSSTVFEGSTGVYERTLSFQIQLGRKDKNANSKWILRIFFSVFVLY